MFQGHFRGFQGHFREKRNMAKKKNIVKYSNTLNEVNFTGLDASELNVLFSIFSVIKDKGMEKQIIPFSDFRKMTGIETKDKEQFVKNVNNTYRKIMGIVCDIETETDIYMFTVVNYVRVSKDREFIEIQANDLFVKFFNDLIERYTIFELKDITELTSKYSKNLYRMLIQFRSTGFCYLSAEQIKVSLDIPETYTPSDILKRCILPAIKELTEKEKIENLKYKAIYDERKQGKPVKAYEFTFTPMANDIIDGQMAFDFDNNRIVTQRSDKKRTDATYQRGNYNYDELEKEFIKLQ